MILVTIGTMLPFDRLVMAMDKWAAEHPGEETFAQIGESQYEPRHMKWTRLLPPQEFASTARRADVIVSHAGTGSYFLASEIGKPIVMLPRLAEKREHTTDHQVHTLRWLSDKPGVYAAMTDDELPAAIERARELGAESMGQFSPFAPLEFISRLKEFIEN